MMSFLINTALAAVAVGLLILVHELGHFLAARAVGVRVEVFSIGFWKKIVSFRRGPTEYRLSLIPLGGYVKLAGEMEGEGSGAPDEFSSKGPGARSVVLVSGVAMNVLYAFAAFILAFSIGVPFEVAEVGRIDKGFPAWEAGLLPGDRIVRINGKDAPDFQDVTRHVALLGNESVKMVVNRAGREVEIEVYPRYERAAGMRQVGFMPPVEPVVTGLTEMGPDGRRPAEEAGIELGDRIVSVGGRPVEYFREIQEILDVFEGDKVEFELLRGDRRLSVEVEPVAVPRFLVGISGVDNEVKALQGGGAAMEAGIQVGDRIVAVGERSVRGVIELEEAIADRMNGTVLTVERGGELVEIGIEVADRGAVDDFMFSFTTGSSNELTWVREGGPAWQAGLRVGDVITQVGDHEVGSWEGILEANARLGGEARTVRWRRDGEEYYAEVVPEHSSEGEPARIGALFTELRLQVRREDVVGAVSVGFQKTYGAFADMLLTIRGFATREVSPQHVGGIVLIAHVAYHAARRGIGYLLYFSAIISIALAFLNILPIPVLDGGHLMFIGIEKIRGRPVGERARGISQTVGLTLLLLLVVYAFRNDLMRIFG